MDELRQLAQLDEARQHLDTAQPLIDARMTELARVVQLRRNGDMTAANARVASGDGRRLTDSIRTEIRDFIRIENLALERVDARFQLSLRRMFYGIVAVSGCALLIGLLIAYLYFRNNEHRLKNLVLVETQDLLNTQAKASQYARSLIEASLDPLVTISPEGKITDVNAGSVKVTGVPREKLIGTDFSNYFTEPDKAREGYQQVFAKGSVTDYPLTIRHQDGTLTDVLYNASVYRDVRGIVLGVFAAARDVTDQKQAEENVRRLNAELEQRVIERTAELKTANTELEAFSYSVSHDLRTPVRAIDGYAQAVLEDYGPQLPAEGLRFLQTISNSARHLGALIDNLLAFAQLKQLELSKHAVDTNLLVRATLHELGAPWPNRQVELRVGALPASSGDAAMLKQVWLNLLSNALKYTNKRDKAEIEIGCRKVNGADTFFVRDNGTGFDMRYVGKLFGVFQRFHRAEDYDGTGVGLAIVQRIVHRHGGRIWAEAAVDRGAIFYFTLEKETKT
jgi:PAS domain S-box-containing protein